MAFDLVIRGGTVVDGSGRPPYEADVMVQGDRIAAIGRHAGSAGEVIDARGKLVTPGFIDIHTHLDAQITWDPLTAPASFHGITSVVMGNCGVGFAPCRPGNRDYLMFLMEGVEDIPQDCMRRAMPWEWGELPRIPALSRPAAARRQCRRPPDARARAHMAMGKRGALDVPPTDDELGRMQQCVREALAAGALGFSSGRTTMHHTPAGDAVPGTFADRRELGALAAPLAELGTGLLQILLYGGAGEDASGVARDLDLLVPLARRLGRPMSVGVTAPSNYPDTWGDTLERIAAANRSGAHIVPQVAPRCVGLLLAFGGPLSPLFLFPAAGDLLGRPEADVRAALRDPDCRRRLVESFDPSGEVLAGMARTEHVFLLERGGVASYETTPERSVVARARARGVPPGEVILDALLASDLRALVMIVLHNSDMRASAEMMAHPLSTPGLGDAGAHTSQTCDMGVGTFTLAYWARDRGLLTIEEAVRKLTFGQALVWGIPGRGLVRPGWSADLNVIDLDRLDLELPELRHDLPGGAPNLSQRARGYTATVVNGVTLFRDGEHTGALPGRVLRNAVAVAA